MSKTWIITGAGRGLGREFAKAALDRGDNVAATARNVAALDDLVALHGDQMLPLSVDVTDRAAVFNAVSATTQRFGKVDVVVNNAGYGLFGAVEEVTPEQFRRQLEVNVLGPFNVTQAVLPLMREQRHGQIIQISSIGGVVAFPLLGAYHASKWALEAFSESLSQEVADLGISVTIVEPGSYGTDWAGPSSVWAEPLTPYLGLRQQMIHAASDGKNVSNVGAAMLAVVDADDTPSRVFFGTAPHSIAEQVYNERLQTWRKTERIARLAEVD